MSTPCSGLSRRLWGAVRRRLRKAHERRAPKKLPAVNPDELASASAKVQCLRHDSTYLFEAMDCPAEGALLCEDFLKRGQGSRQGLCRYGPQLLGQARLVNCSDLIQQDQALGP